jgi:hypothetical protein
MVSGVEMDSGDDTSLSHGGKSQARGVKASEECHVAFPPRHADARDPKNGVDD